MQVVQVQTAMDLAQPNTCLSLPHNFPEGWFKEEVVASFSNFDLKTTNIQLSISKALKNIRFNHVLEHTISMKEMAEMYSINVPPIDIDILTIDIANLEEKIAIEVDGPHHFLLCIDSDNILNSENNHNFLIEYQARGATMLKRRLFKSMGWKVLNIPYWDWNSVEGDKAEETRYCQHLLNKGSTR
jgi:very-short-patch-repair endonuclease